MYFDTLDPNDPYGARFSQFTQTGPGTATSPFDPNATAPPSANPQGNAFNTANPEPPQSLGANIANGTSIGAVANPGTHGAAPTTTQAWTPSGNIGQDLLSQLGTTAPGSSAFQNILNQVNQAYGLQSGQNGYALYYPNNQTVGLADSYLAYNNGQWSLVPRNPSDATNSGAGSPVTPASPTATINADPDLSQLYNLLLGEATQSQTIDPNDPTIKAQTDAYDATTERAAKNYLSDLAESAGPNGNIGAETRMSAENTGQQEAGFQASLMANELTARRDQIQQALSGMAGLLDTNQQASLQLQLAQMNDALSRLQLSQQGSQFQQNLNLQYDEPYLNYIYGTEF